jgi:hypothetical protein
LPLDGGAKAAHSTATNAPGQYAAYEGKHDCDRSRGSRVQRDVAEHGVKLAGFITTIGFAVAFGISTLQ